jgi:hypothetical protein
MTIFYGIVQWVIEAVFWLGETILGALFTAMEWIVEMVYWLVHVVMAALIAVAAGITSLAPDISLPDLSSMVSGIDGFWNLFGWANNFLPVDQLVLIIGLVVTWYVVLLGVRVLLYLLTKAHVLGGAE